MKDYTAKTVKVYIDYALTMRKLKPFGNIIRRLGRENAVIMELHVDVSIADIFCIDGVENVEDVTDLKCA